MLRETYLFVFDTMKKADYWFRETAEKFHDDIYLRDYQGKKLSFPEADYIFISRSLVNRYRWINNAQIYEGDAIYIILDDLERKRLPSYKSELESVVEDRKIPQKIFTSEEKAAYDALSRLMQDVEDLNIGLSFDEDDLGTLMYRQALEDVLKLIKTDLTRLGSLKED